MSPVKIQIIYADGSIKTIAFADLPPTVKAHLQDRPLENASRDSSFVTAPSPHCEVLRLGKG